MGRKSSARCFPGGRWVVIALSDHTANAGLTLPLTWLGASHPPHNKYPGHCFGTPSWSNRCRRVVVRCCLQPGGRGILILFLRFFPPGSQGEGLFCMALLTRPSRSRSRSQERELRERARESESERGRERARDRARERATEQDFASARLAGRTASPRSSRPRHRK